MDTHHKTLIVGISFLITTAGWWAWSAFLSYAYSDNLSPFDVKGGFEHTFGRDWNWWLVVLLVFRSLSSSNITPTPSVSLSNYRISYIQK